MATLRSSLYREQQARSADEVRPLECRHPDSTPVRWANEVQQTEYVNDSSDDETTDKECVISSKRSQVAKKSADLPDTSDQNDECLDVGEYVRQKREVKRREVLGKREVQHRKSN